MSLADREKWDAKYHEASAGPSTPSAALVELADWLPQSGRGLDLAGGAGRHAIWLAKRGLTMTVADISPVGLKLARQRAAVAGVSLSTVRCDLDSEQAVPEGPWDLIVVVCFQCRHLLTRMRAELAPGGRLVIVQPTVTNLTRHSRPSAQYLFKDGELRRLAESLFHVLHYHEGWSADDRHDAVLVAEKR
jgi:tellurite methyltransferase